jgi:hypothetical protein
MPRPKPKKIGVPGRKRRDRYDTGNYFPEDFARKVVRQRRVLLLTEEFEIGEGICRSLVPPGWSRIRL